MTVTYLLALRHAHIGREADDVTDGRHGDAHAGECEQQRLPALDAALQLLQSLENMTSCGEWTPRPVENGEWGC